VVVDAFDFFSGYDAPVTFVDFDHPGINDAGQVVFKAQLQDGTEIIGRAEPHAVATTTTTTLPPNGSCGDPANLSVGVLGGDALANEITASDALFILFASLELQTCELCICDINGSGSITATDALLALASAIGQSITFNCPACE
jgi:hypothetical protein